MCEIASDHLQNKSAGFIFKFMLPVLTQGGAETSCSISLCWSPEDSGKWGLCFQVEKTELSLLPRALQLPSRSRHSVGRKRAGRATSGQQLPRARHCRHSYTRMVHTALPSSRTHAASSKEAQCCLGPRASVAQGVAKLSRLQPGCCPRREKEPSTFKPTLRRLPSPPGSP